ncbi:MAG: glycosyltransferase family 4 protein [Stygiobacter sp.]|uniref:Glycosyltransferase family 4 protein n=1 Tax=Stygiobacter electus TaxID=3032292 RepID=A0AAE3NV67_9BACT|nr:glycosyltransferase family 4 protein [Stygiobacter electus]MDF1611501.1 glycosyltransferase family 4 protein [Stygiobacter electus]
MNNRIKILIFTNELLTTCGVSKHLLYFLSEAKKREDVDFTILCGGGDAIDDYKSLCKEVIVSPVFKHENRSVINFIKAFLFLSKLLVKNKYHIIHSHTHYADNIARLVSYFIKVRTLQTVHGIIEPIGKLNHYPSKYFITVNEHVYDYLRKQKNKQTGNIKLIRNGISVPTNSMKTINKKLKIISAGRLIPEKGFDVFIQAIRRLKKETLDKAEFLIGGKGDYELELKKLAAKLNVSINFIGELKELNYLLLSTNIFVIASRSKSEGFPMTIIEAALNKNLILSSNFLGHDSILKDKINCLIFKVNDPNDLSNKMEYAIENYKDFNDLIERIYDDARKNFSIDKMINETISFYREILK